jgi:hypothetical protein
VAGKKPDNAQKALTIRVPVQWLDVLETARYLRGHDSMQDLVHEALNEFTLHAEQDPAVQKALQTRRNFQAARRMRLVKTKEPDRPDGSTG